MKTKINFKKDNSIKKNTVKVGDKFIGKNSTGNYIYEMEVEKIDNYDVVMKMRLKYFESTYFRGEFIEEDEPKEWKLVGRLHAGKVDHCEHFDERFFYINLMKPENFSIIL